MCRCGCLVVEDHVALADRIAEGLRDAGLAVDVVYDGAAALDERDRHRYDVIVLDRDLPVVHGDRVCRQLVRDGSPADPDAHRGRRRRRPGRRAGTGRRRLSGQAVRVRRADRPRAGAGPARARPPAIVHRGDLVVDRARHRASRGGIPLTLTRKEFGVLECWPAADGAVVSAEELLEHVWDAHADPFSNTVAVTSARLRRKLGDPPLIETVIGVGYRL